MGGSGRSTHGKVKSGVDAERGFFGGEGFAGAQDILLVSSARFLVADVAQRLLAAKRRVVGLAHRQEVRRQVTRHHLARVHEDVRGEEAEGVDT